MLLVYGLKEEKLALLKELSEKYGFSLKSVKDEDTFYTVANLAGLEGADKRKFLREDYPKDMEFLLFCQIDRQDLYGFLQDLDQAGYQFPHKAVMTETNQSWPFSYLLSHIAEEHTLMQAYQRLGKKVKDSSHLKAPEIEQIIKKAKSLSSLGEDLTVNHVLALEKELNQALANLEN